MSMEQFLQEMLGGTADAETVAAQEKAAQEAAETKDSED